MNFMQDETAEKLRGGYYTPPDLALFLARWITQMQPEAVLEPSAGDGKFIRALNTAAAGPTRVTAFELNAVEAA